MADRLDVTASNWLDPPYNRWGYLHVRELARTASISRGDQPVLDLPSCHDPRDLRDVSFEHAGETLSFPEMLEATYTDGVLVLHDGAVLFEDYTNGMAPSDTHLLMSVSKSLASTLCGVLAGRGLLRPEDEVTHHLEELSGSSWDGCTVQHLLDMRAGIRWDYASDEIAILDVSGYRAHGRTDLARDTESWIRSIGRSHEHGGPFRYVSLASDLLGWVLERVGRASFAELFAREIWSAIGAEHAAQILLDPSGFPVVEGGMCTTLRDLGRFGLMCLQRGRIGGRQVVPAQWLSRLESCDRALIDAYAGAPEYAPAFPNAFYHDNWWIKDADRGIYQASGMSGQALLVHRPSRTVVVKLSTHPGFEDPYLFGLEEAGMLALCESLGRGDRQPTGTGGATSGASTL
jgi:CubicO group peptidase (beta-lactamase class C family)